MCCRGGTRTLRKKFLANVQAYSVESADHDETHSAILRSEARSMAFTHVCDASAFAQALKHRLPGDVLSVLAALSGDTSTSTSPASLRLGLESRPHMYLRLIQGKAAYKST